MPRWTPQELLAGTPLVGPEALIHQLPPHIHLCSQPFQKRKATPNRAAGCWAFPDRSLRKAARTVQSEVGHLASVFDCRRQLVAAVQVIQGCLAAGCRINKRKSAPATVQRLLAIGQEGIA
jgi:hypothetical protein